MLKMLRFLKPIKLHAIMTLFFSLATYAMQLILPKLMAQIISAVSTQGARAIPYIEKTGGWMIAFSAVALACAAASSYFSSRTATGFGSAVREAVFVRVESLSPCDLDDIGTPSLITRCTNDIRQIQEMLINVLRTAISAPILLVGGSVMAFIMNRKLSMSIIVIIPVIAVIAFIVSKTVIPLFKKMQLKTDALNRVLREKLSGIRVIRAFNRTRYEDGRFRDANLDLTAIALRISRIFAALIPLAVVLIFSAVIVLLWIAGDQINELDPGIAAERAQLVNMAANLQAFMIYLVMIVFAVSMGAALFIMLPRASVSAKRILEVLERTTAIKEAEKPVQPDPALTGSIEFVNVTFGYPGAEAPVLSNISFKASAGQTIGIIGGTGSGKSTLMSLIPRFYDVTFGEIRIDGVDIRAMSTADLRGKIAYVPQQSLLFSGTVAENLAFGKEDASEDEMWHALTIAQARDFVEALTYQLHDMISQRGENLSGGQKQRIAIARAVVKKAEFTLFDDSFSALDFTTEVKLRKALKEELAASTILIVAQRIGTIIDADLILVIDEGKIVGAGTHRQLLKDCEMYREIAYSQLTKEDLA